MSFWGQIKKIKSLFGAAKLQAERRDVGRLWLMKTLDILPKPFFLIDLQNKRASFSNASARRMLGLDYAARPLGEIYGNEIWVYDLSGQLVPFENLPSSRIIRGEMVNGEEYVLVSRSGRFNIKVFSELIPSMYDQPSSALIVFQDITALKAVENDLRRAQADLNEAVHIAQVGFWSVDTETQKTSVSPQLMKQFGIAPGEFDGDLEVALNRIHPEDRARVIEAIQLGMTQGAPYHIEYRVTHPNGDVRWIEAKSGTTGDIAVDAKRFAGTTFDITERVLSRQALEANEKELRVLADAMPQIVWSAKPSGELDYFNQRWFDYSGSDYAANVGNGWAQFVHPDDIPHTVERWTKSLATSESYENEFRLLHHSGQYRWHVARARAIFENGASGKVKKWYGTNTDIHDQKMLTEKLDEARAAAERANSAKSQFLANMSHEIRTPLGAIMGFSELIKDESLDRAEREEYVSVVERNSSQLLRIIDDILDLSKVEAGMMAIENIEFSLPEALSDFSSLMGLKAREKGIRFTTKAETSLPSTIYSDPTRLRQILMNVVGNAIKFTDSGHVDLRVRFVDDYLDFEVEDTGRGISAEQEKNLFQPFTQADASITRKYGGTGLGLVLTRSLAEALGGHFNLKKSELGRGSTFAVRVKAPAKPGAKLYSGVGFETAPPKAAMGEGKLAGFTVLLVEDSPDNQALLSIYLNRAGAKIEIAGDGAEGLKMAMTSVYDIVLMDVQMPVMDGITAVKKLRESGYIKPIVALTAHAMKEERQRCLQAGFNDFLSKPVNREELINMILASKQSSGFET